MGYDFVLTSVPTSSPKGEPKVGDLLTVDLAGNVRSGARLERIAHGNYFVRLVGLEVPKPYRLGDRYPLTRDKIVDWG